MADRPSECARRKSLRRFFLLTHQYAGLSIGWVFALLGITGMVLVFYVEIDRQLNPAIQVRQADQAARPLAAVVDALRRSEPQRAGAWRLELPLTPGSPIMARYYKPTEKAHLAFAPLIATVDPYTLEVTSKRFWGDFAMTWIYDLHYSLLLDKTGKTVLGIVGLLLLILLAAGAIIWWPAGRWKQALRFKPRASFPRRIYDLHTIVAAITFPVVLVVVISGIILVVPDWFKPGIHIASPLTPFFEGDTLHPEEKIGLDADRAIAIAQRQFPDAQLRWVETPSEHKKVWRVMLRQPGEVGTRFPRTNVWIDATDGRILATRDPTHNSGGDIFMDWLHPLHSGEAFGLAGRLIILLSGIVPILLLITGSIRWLQKKRASQTMPRQPASSSIASR
jgi:uncharacterized iron-regulated membrane protein